MIDIDNKKSNPLKALDILEGLSHFPSGASLAELCECTELNKSSAYRILCALTERKYVIRDDVSKTYKLSFKILSLSSAVLDSIEIKKLARTQLRTLSEISGETVHLLCRDGNEGLYIDKIDTPNTIGLKSQVGKRIPLYCTGGGKVLLAFADTDFRIKYLETTHLTAHTKNTITDPEILMAELEKIRKQGYALDDQEHHDNITCVSVPVFSRNGEIEASISISAPSYRFSTDLALSYIPAMKKQSSMITQNMPF